MIMFSRPGCALLCLLALSGCNRIESPRDQWYRDVRGATLLPIPFSHDLELVGYAGWQFLGKLPAPLARADAVEVALHVEEEALTEAGGASPVFTTSWEPGPSDPRRVDLDLLVLRAFEDGRPVFRYRAVVNGKEIDQIFAAPEGYRHEMSVRPAPDPVPIRPGSPIPVGTATITSWSRDAGERTDYNLITRTYTWFLQFNPIGDD